MTLDASSDARQPGIGATTAASNALRELDSSVRCELDAFIDRYQDVAERCFSEDPDLNLNA